MLSCFLYRSGRTGRAGKTGVCVTLVGRNKEGLIPFIEKKAGVKFERTGAPQPADMARVAGAATLLRHVLPLYSCGPPHVCWHSFTHHELCCCETCVMVS